MRARYVGVEPSTTTFGKTFHQFKWVKADDLSDEAKAALAANPTFETDGAPMDAETAQADMAAGVAEDVGLAGGEAAVEASKAASAP